MDYDDNEKGPFDFVCEGVRGVLSQSWGVGVFYLFVDDESIRRSTNKSLAHFSAFQWSATNYAAASAAELSSRNFFNPPIHTPKAGMSFPPTKNLTTGASSP